MATCEKVRFNGAIPLVLYNRLQDDSKKYGTNMIDIVTVALTEYYKSIDSRLAVPSKAE